MRLPDLGGDRFVLKDRLGTGGFGAVYRAFDTVQQGEVALKTMHGADPVALGRLKREFRSLAGIVHPNLVTLYHLFVDDEWYFTMELVEGVHFLRHVRTPLTPSLPSEAPTPPAVPRPRKSSAPPPPSKLDEDRLRAALPQVVAAVDALHRAGKLHRDIKSSNVLVRPDGRVVVCDFGLVLEMQHEGRTESTGKSGTPSYMSPEQVAGKPFAAPSDWYAVGALLYEALTGHAPFEGNVTEIVRAKQQEMPRWPTEHDASAPPDLSALAMSLLATDPDERPTAPEVLAALGVAPAAHAVRPSAAFVGRDRELDALDDALEASRTGRTVTMLVHGPSGIGKTSLCRRFLERAARRGAVVLEGRCYERESVPYNALDTVVDSLTQHLLRRSAGDVSRLLTEDAVALARLFPQLRRVALVETHRRTSTSPLDPQRLRAAAFTALRDALAALGRDGPTILFIDDLHWGDRDSAGFLVDLVHGRAPVPVLLLGSYRSEDEASSPLLRALLAPPMRAGDLRRIALAPLADEDGASLAAALLGDRAGAPAIVAEAGGHPFFISVLAGAEPSERGHTLDDVLRARIEHLPDGARALLAAAAVAGVPTPVALLGQVAEVADLPSALATLRAQSMIRARSSDDALDEDVEPYHDRVRVAAAAMLSPDDTARLHRRLALAHEARGSDSTALVGHWRAAGEPLRTALHAARAARQAEDALAFARAAHYHAVVLELGELTAETRRVVEGRRADALAHAGNLVEAARAYQAAADGAAPAAALHLRRRAVELLLRSGELEAGMHLATTLAAEVGVRVPDSRRSLLTGLVGRRAWLGMRGLRMKPRPIERIDPALLRRIDVCGSLAAGLTFADPILGAWFQTRQLHDALRAGDPARAAFALALEAGFRSVGGAPTRAAAERAAAAGHALAETLGDEGLLGWIAAARALAAFLCGDFEQALELVVAGERGMTGDPRYRWQLDHALIYRTAILWHLGRLRELSNLMPLLLREAGELGDVYLTTALSGWRSNVVWLLADEPAEARRRLAEAAPRTLATRFHLHHYYQLLGHVQIDLYQGDGAAAWARVEAARPEIEASTLPRVQMTRIELQFLRARCALAAGGDDRLADAERCVTAIEKEKLPFGDALARLVAAAVAARRKHDVAVARFEEAIAACRAAGMRHLAAAARWRLGEILGGTRGADELRGAGAWLADEHVAAPERLVAMLCPV